MAAHLIETGIFPGQIVEMNFESNDFRKMTSDAVYANVKNKFDKDGEPYELREAFEAFLRFGGKFDRSPKKDILLIGNMVKCRQEGRLSTSELNVRLAAHGNMVKCRQEERLSTSELDVRLAAHGNMV